MPTVMVTFVKATYILATFVHISKISTVTDRILIKVWDTIFCCLNFCGPRIFRWNFFWPKYFSDQNCLCLIFFHFFYPQIVLTKRCFALNFLGSTNILTQVLLGHISKMLWLYFFGYKFCFDQKCFGPYVLEHKQQ